MKQYKRMKRKQRMIKKVYVFNERHETLIRRVYAATLSDDEMRQLVLATPDCNFVRVCDTLVYKKIDGVYMCMVAADENEMYVLGLIGHLAGLIGRLLESTSEAAISYSFKECHALLDAFILDGKVVCLDQLEILSACAPSQELN